MQADCSPVDLQPAGLILGESRDPLYSQHGGGQVGPGLRRDCGDRLSRLPGIVLDMPVSEIVPAFPVPFAAPESQSWRDIGASLRNNALAGFSPRVFEERVVARRFAGRAQIILNDPAAIRHVLIENSDNYRRTAA